MSKVYDLSKYPYLDQSGVTGEGLFLFMRDVADALVASTGISQQRAWNIVVRLRLYARVSGATDPVVNWRMGGKSPAATAATIAAQEKLFWTPPAEPSRIRRATYTIR